MADSKCKPVFGSPAPAAPALPRVRLVNRDQFVMRNLDVEQLIAQDHAARAIWELVGRLELSSFYEKVKAWKGVPDSRPLIRD